MIKNGILTFQFAHNYGAQLQAYALKKFLSNNQIDTEIINYTSKYFTRFYKLWPVFSGNLVKYIRAWKRTLLRLKQYNLFIQFTNKYLEINLRKAFQDSNRISNYYTSIVVGSDQVWNLKLTDNDRTYYLTDIICPTKIAYAASFGENTIIELLNCNDIISLREFKALSIREESAVYALEGLIKKRIDYVIDPVFLLDYKDWKKLERKPNGVNSSYICLISLKEDMNLIEECVKLEKISGLKTISIHPMCWKQKFGHQLFNVGPLEYLWLIDHAAYVVTNSFHAVAFSILMDKKVICKTIDTKNNRISSLLSLFPDIQDSNKIIDFSKIDKSFLTRIIQFSKKFLIYNLKETSK